MAPELDVKKTHVALTYKHGSPLISCRFDLSGKFVFFGAQDFRVWRWEVGTDKKVELKGHDSWVRGIALHPGGEDLLTAGFDGRVIWWPVKGDKVTAKRTLEAHQGWARAVAISPDGSQLATVGNDLLVKVWSMTDGKLVRQMAGHKRHVYQVAFHPDGKQLATGDLMGNLFHWEVDTGKLVRQLSIAALHKYDKGFGADIGGFRDMRFSRDGKLLACAGITNVTNAFAGVGNPLVELWDWETGKQRVQHSAKAKIKGVAWGVALHPEGFLIGAAGGSDGGHLLFWKGAQKEEFHHVKLPDTARDMDLSPDGMSVVTAHYDGHLRIHKLTEKA